MHREPNRLGATAIDRWERRYGVTIDEPSAPIKRTPKAIIAKGQATPVQIDRDHARSTVERRTAGIIRMADID